MIDRPQPIDIDKRIVELVQQCWREHQVPLLLSRLGTQEDGQIAEVARQQAGGLADYLRAELSDHVRVIKHSRKSMVVGAIPSHVATDIGGNFDPMLEKTYSSSESPFLYFRPAFWTAFRKPLSGDDRRYVSLKEPIHFSDTPSTEQPEEYAEIQRPYIMDFDADTSEVLGSLKKWVADNDLDLALFASTRKTEGGRLPSNNLLDRLLSALNPDDLKRLSLPLDVVDKLRREQL